MTAYLKNPRISTEKTIRDILAKWTQISIQKANEQQPVRKYRGIKFIIYNSNNKVN